MTEVVLSVEEKPNKKLVLSSKVLSMGSKPEIGLMLDLLEEVRKFIKKNTTIEV